MINHKGLNLILKNQDKSFNQDLQKSIQDYLPLVKKEARIIADQLNIQSEKDDLIQAGLTGLFEAIKNYKPGPMGIAGFARQRIRGAIIDEVRKRDWRPRRISRMVNRINQEVSVLQQLLGRPPSEKEIAEHMKITIEDYHKMLDEISIGSVDILELFSLTDDALKVKDYAEQERLKEETTALLVNALRELPIRERQIMVLYYEQELSMIEIGKILCITEARVCQLHKQALIKLRAIVKTQKIEDNISPTNYQE